MGYFFTNKLNFFEKILKMLILKIIKFILYLDKSVLVLENKDDLNFFVKRQKIPRKNIKISRSWCRFKNLIMLKKTKKNRPFSSKNT